MKLRAALVRLTLLAIVPAILIAVGATLVAAHQQRRMINETLTYTAQAIHLAVATKLESSTDTLAVLAKAIGSETHDANIRALILAVMGATDSKWRAIAIADHAGVVAMQQSAPNVAPVETLAGLGVFARARAGDEPAISDVLYEDGASAEAYLPIAIAIPDGARADRVLLALVDDGMLSDVLSGIYLPDDWTATVFSAKQIIMARSRAPQDLVGLTVPDQILLQLAGPGGQFRATTIDGIRSIGAFYRDPESDWIFFIAAPATRLFDIFHVWPLAIAFGGLVLIGIGGVTSVALGRRIAGDVMSLADPTDAAVQGKALSNPSAQPLFEVGQIRHKMDKASDLIGAHDRQQAAIAALGLEALTTPDRQTLFESVTNNAAAALDTEMCEILELLPDGRDLVLRAGSGWQDSLIGSARVSATMNSQAAYTFQTGEPVVVPDFATETRFQCSPLQIEQAVVSSASVAIYEAEKHWGVLAVHSRTRRDFTTNDVAFLQTLSNIVSAYLTRTMVEAAQAESERRRRHLIESIRGVPYVYDGTDDMFLYVGPQAEQLTGYSADAWIESAHWWHGLIHPDDRNAVIEKNRRLTAIGENFELEYRAITADGRTIWLRDIARIEKRENTHTMLYGIYLDVTESKLREKQLIQSQKMEAVGQLTGGIAHDFNNMLSVIVGTAELLQGRPDMDPALATALRSIEFAADRGAELARQLLTFGRRQALDPSVEDPNKLIEELLPLIRRTLRDDIVVESQLQAGIHPVLTDRTQLESAILNLAINARDAMPDGGRLLIKTSEATFGPGDIRMDEAIKPGRYILIAVTDTGTGMSQEVRAHALEPFFTTKEMGRGSGLGLSVIYGFARQSGGHLNIYSELGVGTTMRLYLPIGDEAEVKVMQPEDRPADTILNKRILIVEDDPGVREVVAALLDRIGCAVVEAGDAASALSLLETDHGFDLVLTDMIMAGGMNGLALAHEIRRRWPAIAVVISTGYADQAELRDPITGNRIEVISKPYRKADLIRALQAAFSDGHRH